MTIYKKIIISLLVCASFGAYSQSDSLYLNSINVEILGPSAYGTINYDRMFIINQSIAAACSLGGFYNSNSKYVTPQLNILLGNRNYVEVGYALNRVFSSSNKDNTTNSLRVGYRYQNIRREGFMFRAAFTPLLDIKILGKKYFLPWIGFTFGYNFQI